MKKIFFFVAAMMAAISMNAQAVYDWTGKVGTTNIVGADPTKMKEGKVKVHGAEVDCIELGASFFVKVDNVNVATNYVEIAPASGSFQEGDVVYVTFCINNSDATKNAILGIFDANDNELAFGDANNTYSSSVDPSELQYAVTAELATLRLGRKNGNTKTCITKLEVVRGGEVIPVAAKPVFSVTSGTYFEPFKVGITSSSFDKIFVSVNNGVFEEYNNDSILIDQYDVDYTLSAYATLEGAENSDTATVTYKLAHFVARPVFKARKEYTFAGITAEQINILSPATAEKSTYNLDGTIVPSINYIHMTHEERDSFMVVSVKDYSDVTFRYKNSQNQNNTMKFAEDFLQIDKKGFELWIENVQAGDTIVFVVTAKGSTPRFDNTYSSSCYLDPYMPADKTDPCYNMMGYVFTTSDAKIEDNYSGWTDLVYTVQSGRNRVRIKEMDNGYRIAKILVGAYRGVEAVENVNATVKAIKTIENGQLVIIKNGVRYNALGAQL